MKKSKTTFTDYLSILYSWKKFFIITILLIAVITTTITYLIPEKFKASATIMISQEENKGTLSNMLSNVGSLFGGSLFVQGSSSIDKMFGYLESRRIAEKVIKKFKLENYYGFSKYKHDRTLKAFREDVNFDLTTNGFIKISMIHESPDTSAMIVNYIVDLLDSLNHKIILENATSYRKFIEKRYQENLKDLTAAEQDMKSFQEKYKIFVLPDQFKASFDAVSKLESEFMIKKLKLDLIRETKGINSPEYNIALKDFNNFKNQINDIKKGKSVEGSSSLIFFPIKEMPEIYQKYFRIYRELKIQSKLLDFLLPIYEQAKMEEQKDIPTIIEIDKAIPPELKYYPKKAFIIISVIILFLFFEIPMVLRANYLLASEKDLNIIQNKEKKFYSWIAKTFRILAY